VAVRIRLKRMGRKARPFYRLCATDVRAPRDGKVIEELGHYDPMVPDTDARAILKGERIDYWLSVGAQPSEAAATLIKKYGTNGTHAAKQKAALDHIKSKRRNQPLAQAPTTPAAQ
jgi:small subunit ribosomal protein S16